MAVGVAEAQHVHRAHTDADATTDARAGGVVQHLLFERVTHHIDADLAVARAFVAADALVVGDDFEFADFELRKEMRLQMHQLRQWAPVTAPHFAAEERI